MTTESSAKVRIRGLYKVFGSNPIEFLDRIRKGLSKSELLDLYGHVLGLNNINIDIPARHIQVIMGLSGSGKSTLIRHINRLIEPTAGEVVVDGENVLEMTRSQLREFRRAKASMVFQKFALLPHRSVTDNVAYGLLIQGIEKRIAEERSRQWIDRVGLTGYEDYYTSQLSGGMQQRVGLARALATDAEILLMDEPFSALDPLIRTDMQEILLDLQTELHKTIVFITHDLDEALRLGNNIAILRAGEIVQIGSAQEIVMHPADDYISNFIKEINRGRVIKVSSVMDKKLLGGEVAIDADASLEEALQIVSRVDKKVATVIKDNQPVGTINLNSIVTALAKPV